MRNMAMVLPFLATLATLLGATATSRPAWADAEYSAPAREVSSPAFRDTFEQVLDENYSFMERELKHLGEQGVIELGNYSHLSLDQRIAVLSYTYSTYEPVNARLRKGGFAAAEIAPYVQVLNSALELLGRYNGVVLRTVDRLPPAVLAQHQLGATVIYAAYTSTAKRRSLTAAYNFTIRSRTGADLDGYASNSNEQEVLFKPGTSFRVTSRTVKDGRTYIEMEELP